MSHFNGKAAAGVDNTQRRKWDKEEYAAKGAERRREEARVVSVAFVPLLTRSRRRRRLWRRNVLS